MTEVAAEQGLIFTDLEAALHSDGRHHRLRTLTVDLPQGKAHLTLALDGVSPFALEGEGGFDGVIETHALALQLAFANTLLEPRLVAEAQAQGLQARVEAEAASFEANPLRRLAIKAGEFDPAAFVAGAPRAALSLDAELAAPTAHEGLLAGPIRLTNTQPAAVDAKGIPLRSLAGVLDWRSGEMALDVGGWASEGSFNDSSGSPAQWAKAVLDAKNGDPESVVILDIGDPSRPWQDRVWQMTDMLPRGLSTQKYDLDYGPAFDAATGLVEDACAGFVPPT